MKGRKYGLRLKVKGLRIVIACLIIVFNSFIVQAQNDSISKKITQPNKAFVYDVRQINAAELKSIQVANLSELLAGRVYSKNIHTYNPNTFANDTAVQPLKTSGTSISIQNKKRIKLITIGNIVGYGIATYGFYTAWYKDYPKSKFHFFNDNAEWLQVDKIGHMYGAYIESKGSMEMWRWAGLPRKQRIWVGGLSGVAYQTMIETLDGFSQDWGWSWGDFTANVLGSGLLISQELLWDEQRVDLKFSFHKKTYNEPVLKERTDSIFGKNLLSRMLKDYNGQTYWLSANLKSFFPKSNLPAWLNVAVGYGAEGLLDADENIWINRNGVKIDRTDIPRYRQWFIAPDINLTKIKTKSKFLKVALFFFNSFKFPLPSIGFSKKGVEWNWLHF